jgi:hypothetical protein
VRRGGGEITGVDGRGRGGDDAAPVAAVTPGFRRQTKCEPCTCQDQQFTYTTVT